jgi:LytS/YehU family sensor histidine kinase
LLKYQFTIKRPFYFTPWFIFTVLVVLTLSIYWYIRAREQRLKAIERLEKEKVDFQFQTLRSQVNPHFLFNSFNTLLNIIDVDQQSASEYVQRLSDFFRNLLTYREHEVILLSEELAMLEDYYYLQQRRYGENFMLEVNIEHPERYYIPPMTLQLLVENALKHNVVSRQKPLKVAVVKEDDVIEVRNNLQRKREAERSTRVGLSNVIKRYKILFDKEVKVMEYEEHFIVKLPIIKSH